MAEASRMLFLRSPAVHGLRSAVQLSDALAERQVLCRICSADCVTISAVD